MEVKPGTHSRERDEREGRSTEKRERWATSLIRRPEAKRIRHNVFCVKRVYPADSRGSNTGHKRKLSREFKVQEGITLATTGGLKLKIPLMKRSEQAALTSRSKAKRSG